MKKIILSLSVIVAVAAVVAGATTAYFSDTETAENNTFTAGTVDIDIDDQNPWQDSYHIDDLKPGETDYITFTINNVGQNPVNISKKLFSFDGTGGVEEYECGERKTSSEPECEAEGNTSVDDIETQIVYDLSVEVENSEGNKIWWQTIYSEEEGKRISEVYDEVNYVSLGMIPVGGSMIVTQSYHLDEGTDNEYQGDKLAFDIEIKADQLTQEGGVTVTLENKSGDPDWNILEDNINGSLTYQKKGPEFDYSFTGHVNSNVGYTLIYVGPSGDYPCPNSKVIDSGSASGGVINLSGTSDLGTDIVDGKIWLIPSSTYDESSNTMDGWDHDNNLYETALVSYDDTDL